MTTSDYYAKSPCWCLSNVSGPDGYCDECKPSDWMVCPRDWCQEPLKLLNNQIVCGCGYSEDI